MRAIVIHEAKDLRIEETALAEPGRGEVQIRLAAGGICGSDLHYYNHGGFGTIRLKEPMILGHEVSGYVSALGEDVSDLEVGDLVSVSPSKPCRHCQYCQLGNHNHCENMRFYGSAMPFPHIQGAFRQRLIADAGQCVPADGLTPAQAAMAEPLAVCLHAIRQAGDLVGKTVLVTGCGPIGALCILAARRAGAGKIIATDLSDFTLSVAASCGADVALNLTENPDAIAPYAQGKGTVDIQLECSGSAAALASGIAMLRPGGTVVQLGMGGDMTLPVQSITAKEITLRGSFRFHPEFATAVQMMQQGLIEVSALITHSFPLDQAVAAFDMAGDRRQAMKAQIVFDA